MALPSHSPTDPHAILAPEMRWYDASGRVSKGMFPEDWARYVLESGPGACRPAGRRPRRK